MAKKQKKNGGGRKTQAQGAVAAASLDAFEPAQMAQGAPVQTDPIAPQAVGDPDAHSLPGQPTPEATVQAFSFSFNVPKKQKPPEWQSVMVRILPEDGRTLQSLADVAGMPLSTFCRAILHSAAQQAREQGAE